MCIREVKPDPFKQFFNISKPLSILVTYFIHMIKNVSESCDVKKIKKSQNLSLNLFSSKYFFHFFVHKNEPITIASYIYKVTNSDGTYFSNV